MSLHNLILVDIVWIWPWVSDVLPGYMPYLIYNNMSEASDVLPIVKFSGHMLKAYMTR